MKFVFLVSFFLNNFVLYSNPNNNKVYYCPMHPSYTSDKPGTCPICKMDLVLMESDKKHVETEEDVKTISIKENISDMLGIKTSKVINKEFIFDIVMPGIVLYDKELYGILEEYKYNLKLYNTISDSEKKRIGSILDSIAIKAINYGLDEKSIIEFIDAGYKGLIFPDKTMFIAAYLDEIYLNNIKKGDDVEVYQYKKFKFYGKVIAVSNIIDENRRAKIIVSFTDNDMILKYGMYIEARFRKNVGKRTLIPKDSYIEYGDEDVVYVKSKDSYKMRMIKTGLSNSEYTEVIEGLVEGEEIVSSPNFLIDSETRLKGAINSHSH